MSNEPTNLDVVIAMARAKRHEREQLEDSLERCRRESRALAIQMIFDFELSLSKVAMLTGHMRPTLRVWIESEVAKRADQGKTSHVVD